MPKEDPKVEEKGGLFLVDPNPPGRGSLPAEDMFIYVKFTATERSRGINESRDGEINFIATEVKYDASGEPIKNLMGKTESYATTNYTDIGGVRNSNSSGSLEGFGIRNISIKYNASLVPQVDIDFTDVRGSALFDIIEQDNRKSPYSLFFKMPYPIFTLTVKGYFGKPVVYCLHMVNWNSKFDSTTGNFDISANFLGFQQAFLADITIGNIIGVNNTTQGQQALKNLPMEVQDPISREDITLSSVPGYGIGTPPLDVFVKKISKLQVDLEFLKTKSEKYDKLKVINTQQKKLKVIQSFIGKPLRKDGGNTIPKDKPTKPYDSIPNTTTTTNTAGIDAADDDFNIGDDYLSIRDYLIFKYSKLISVNQYMQTLNNLLDDYQEFKVLNADKLNNISDGIIINGDRNTDIFAIGKEGNYLDGLEVKTSSNEIIKLPKTNAPKFTSTLESALDLLKRELVTTPPSINGEYDKKNIDINNYIRPLKAGSNFFKNDPVFILDFTKMRSEIERMLIDIKVIIKEQTKIVNTEINTELKKSIGFNPTIKTVFTILCNNIQALIQATFSVAESAEKNNKKRIKELKGYYLDIESSETGDYKNSTIYGFPKIMSNDDEGIVEKYIGSKDLDLTPAFFPEIPYIENITAGIVETSAELKRVKKLTNKLSAGGTGKNTWVPINPIDVTQSNPFTDMNTIYSIKTPEESYLEFYKILFSRYSVAKTYSKMNPGMLAKFGTFDGINAKNSIIEKTVLNVLSDDIKDKSYQSIINKGLSSEYLEVYNGNTIIKEIVGDTIKLNETPISGFRNINGEDVDYISIEPPVKILSTKYTLWPEITDSESYKSLYGEDRVAILKEKSSKKYYISYTNSTLLTVNACYSVWSPVVNDKLQKPIPEKGSPNFIITGKDITLIDGGLKLLENGTNKTGTPIATNYINLSGPGADATISIPQYLTDTELWANNTDTKVRALLLLNTLPFVPFQKIIDEVITKVITKEIDGETTKIIKLPYYYLAWVCGSLWRATQTIDPISWTSEFEAVDQNMYINTIGKQKAYGTDTPTISDSLLNLSGKTKDTLIKFFTDYVEGTDLDTDLQDEIIIYSKAETIETKYNAGLSICGLLDKEINLIIYASDIFTPMGITSGLEVDSGFKNYYKSFKGKFSKDYVPEEETDPTLIDRKNEQLEVIKLQIYNYFKNIYDKWIAGSTKENLSYNACSTDGADLIDYFKFIDRGFNDIGNTAVINLDSITTISENMNTNAYFFISKLLRDSNFLFQIMPNYINYKDLNEVVDIFKPITNISDRNTVSGPVYLCIYIGASSEHLDINEKSRYTFKNDGFSLFDNPPPDMVKKIEKKKSKLFGRKKIEKEKNDDYSLVGFRVAFGAENQTMFKSVSLNQQEHRETGEYFAALTDLIDKRGGTQRTYQGTDLYRIFKTRSYKSEVEALGCMNIQPMMYFQLDNVPFFNGAYMILNVTHNITPNHMTTTFSGLRQSKILTPPVTEITTFLDSDLTDVLDGDDFTFSNRTDKNPDLYNIGVDLDKEPDTPFDQIITSDILVEIGVESSDASAVSATLNQQLKLSINGVNSKSQLTMLLSNMLTKSRGNFQIVEPWSVIVEPTDNQLDYYSKDNPYGNPVNGEIYQNNLLTSTQLIQIGGPNEAEVTELSASTVAHKYRKRGYIPIIGVNEYYLANTYVNNILPIIKATPKNIFNNPDLIDEDPILAVMVSIWKWKNTFNDENKSPFNYGNGGSAQNFTETINILSGPTTSKDIYFQNFARVLFRFDLLGINIDGTPPK